MRERERLERTVAAIAQDDYASRHAIAGWMYAARFDARFLDAELVPQALRQRSPAPPARLGTGDARTLAPDAASHLARVAGIGEVVQLHAALEELVALCAWTHDDGVGTAGGGGVGGGRSFCHDATLNVVVIGAGPIGLALASAIRVALGPSADILVVENRVASPGRKRAYERRWLTAVGHDCLTTIVEPSVRDLVARIGTASHIGVTIDVLETLLYLSCVRMGVRFLFDERPDLSFVGERPVHLVFDATGNRLQVDEADASVAVGPPIALDSSNVRAGRFASYGVDVTAPTSGAIHIATAGGVRYPLVDGRRLVQAMVKITQVPARLCDALVDLVRRDNHDNKHYVWRGSLREEINHGLVLVNLARAEYEALWAAHVYPLGLAAALASPALRAALDARTIELLVRIADCTTQDELARVEIDAPFVWRPYWNTSRNATLHGAPLVRIGDSIYNGNVKLANGLGPHLRHVAHVQQHLWQHATSRHAERIARSIALPR
ncbi:MAG: hypothetical protein ACKV2T_35890 [Kofleriaceae bacterium]